MTTDERPRKVTMTSPTERELRFERTFDHPRERVWRALTDPGLITQWWGGGTNVEEMDVRVGGKWRFVADRGAEYPFVFQGEYLELDPPRRLVQTSENGWNGLITTETIELEDLGGSTLLIQTSTFGTAADLASAGANGAEQGATYQFMQLDRLLSTLQGGE